MVNEGFDEIKIGHSKNLKNRKGTFNTATPKPYHIYAIYETDGLKDKKVHNIIKNLNPTLHYNNEFFNMTPEQAYLLFKNIAAINGFEDNLHYNPHKDDYITKTYGKNPPKKSNQNK